MGPPLTLATEGRFESFVVRIDTRDDSYLVRAG